MNKLYIMTRLLCCFFIAGIVVCGGCSKEQQTSMAFDPTLSIPQLIVNPVSIRLGVAVLMKGTKIEFQGKGFDPGDSVFVSLEGVQKEGQMVSVPIADGMVEDNGAFSAEVIDGVKISELLRADITLNDEMETLIVISRPTIPPGEYTVRAKSMDTDKTAVCKMTIEGPSVGDSIKNWLGVKTGKIIKK